MTMSHVYAISFALLICSTYAALPAAINTCADTPCVRKCCPADQVWDFVKDTCKKTSESYEFVVEFSVSNITIVTGRACPIGSQLVPQETRPVNISFVNDDRIDIDGRQLKLDEYCLDDVESDGVRGRVLFICGFLHDILEKDTVLDKIPVKKCCAGGEAFSVAAGECLAVKDTKRSWIPLAWSSATNETVNISVEDVHVTHEQVSCPDGFIAEESTDFIFMEDGTVSLRNTNLEAGSFCLDSTLPDETSHVVRYCRKDPCRNGTACVKKCCPEGYIYHIFDEVKPSCLKSELLFQPEFRSLENINESLAMDPGSFSVLYGSKPNCMEPGFNLINPEMYPEEAFFLLPDSGNLYITGYAPEERELSEYCIDNFHIGSTVSLRAFICFPPTPTQDPAVSVILATYPVFLFISVFFLTITFLVYAILPELHNLHGLTTMSLVFCMIVTYLGLGIIQTSGRDIIGAFCISTAITVHYFFLAIFTWLSVMGFDIWLTFSTSHPDGQSVEFWLDTLMPSRSAAEFPQPLEESSPVPADYGGISNSDLHSSTTELCSSSLGQSDGNLRVRSSLSYDVKKRRFVLYSIYAWSVPLIIVVTGQVIEHFVDTNTITPGFGVKSCWFQDNWSLLCYFYGPIGLICIVNIVFFVLTAVKLYMSGKDTAFATHNNNPRERFRVILYLFVLTGVFWILEVVSFVVKGSPYIWMIPDIFNICTGIFIFIIFVCKRKVVQLLRQRSGLFNRCCERIGGLKRFRNRQSGQSVSTLTDNVKRKSSTTLCTQVVSDSTLDVADRRKWC